MDILSFKTSNLEIHRIKSDTFPSYPPSLTSPEAMAVTVALCPASLLPVCVTRRHAGHFPRHGTCGES